MSAWSESTKLTIWHLVKVGLLLAELRNAKPDVNEFPIGEDSLTGAQAIVEVQHLLQELELADSGQLSQDWLDGFIEDLGGETKGVIPHEEIAEFIVKVEQLTVKIHKEARQRSVFVVSPDPETERYLNDPRVRFGVLASHRITPIGEGETVMAAEMLNAMRCLALAQFAAVAFFALRSCERFLRRCWLCIKGSESGTKGWNKLLKIIENKQSHQLLSELKDQRNELMHPDPRTATWDKKGADELLDRVRDAIQGLSAEVDSHDMRQESGRP